MGKVLLSFSVAGLPLALLLLRCFGRWGGLVVGAGCGALFVRDVAMVATGTPARLKPLPRALLILEMGSSGVATLAGFRAWVQGPFIDRPAGPWDGDGTGAHHGAARGRRGSAASSGTAAGRAAVGAAAATFVLHAAREAIYLRPGHGRR